MTRDFLKNLGVEDATIDKILDENMSDIGKEKRKTEAAEGRLATAKTDLEAANGKLSTAQTELETLKKANGDVAAVQQQLSDLQKKYDTDTAALKGQLADRDYSDAISKAIAGKGLKFSSKAAERAFTDALMKDRLELKDGELTGLDDFIKAQKEADPDAFAPDNPPPRFGERRVGGGGGQPETTGETLAAQLGKTAAEQNKAANDIISMYMGSNTADVSIVDTGIAVAVVVTEDPVNTKTTVSEIVLPSYERMDETYVIKVA